MPLLIAKDTMVRVEWFEDQSAGLLIKEALLLEEETFSCIFGKVIIDDTKRIYIQVYSISGVEELSFNIPKKDIKSITILKEL